MRGVCASTLVLRKRRGKISALRTPRPFIVACVAISCRASSSLAWSALPLARPYRLSTTARLRKHESRRHPAPSSWHWERQTSADQQSRASPCPNASRPAQFHTNRGVHLLPYSVDPESRRQ